MLRVLFLLTFVISFSVFGQEQGKSSARPRTSKTEVLKKRQEVQEKLNKINSKQQKIQTAELIPVEKESLTAQTQLKEKISRPTRPKAKKNLMENLLGSEIFIIFMAFMMRLLMKLIPNDSKGKK